MKLALHHKATGRFGGMYTVEDEAGRVYGSVNATRGGFVSRLTNSVTEVGVFHKTKGEAFQRVKALGIPAGETK